MASGAAISITGGVTMTSVVAGVDTVQATDFNNARTNVNAMLGAATDVTLGSFSADNTYGYSQGGAGVSAAVVAELIYADNVVGGFKRLQDDVQSLCAFLGQTVRAGVGVDVTTTDIITAATWNNLMLNIKDCWDNRFTSANTSVSTENSVIFNDIWGISLEQITTWTWGNEAECRAFFNAGGAIGASSSRIGGSATPENANWSDLLSSMGNVFMKYNSTEAASGIGTELGFYNLTTSYQQLFIKFGSGSHVNNFFKVEGRINSVSNPTEVSLKYTWSEQYANNIDGFITLNALRLQPNSNGSSIIIVPGIASASSITSLGVVAPSFVLLESSDNVDEGNSVTISVVTTNFGNGILYWTVEGTGNAQATSADFVEDSGNVTITNNTGSFIITTTADLLTEGEETFRVQLRTDSIEGLVVANSAVITINDTSTITITYSITSDVTAVGEGNSVTMSVVTTDFGNGILYWDILHESSDSEDFVEDSGTVTITNDEGSFIITTAVDLLTEGEETFRVQLRTDSNEGTVVANSDVITIIDITYSIIPDLEQIDNEYFIDEGDTVVFNISTTNFGSGTLYYTMLHDGSGPEDFVGGDTGSITIIDDAGVLVLETIVDEISNFVKRFVVQLRINSIEGTFVAASGEITINDVLQPITFQLVLSDESIDEGNDELTFVISVVATNYGSGELYWEAVPSGTVPAEASDFVESFGVVVISNNLGSFEIRAVADLLTEGPETFVINLFDAPNGELLATSDEITINDTSTTPTTYSITPNVTAVDEGNSVTMSVVTTDFGNGILYWNTFGVGTSPASNTDFVTNSGNVTITNNTGSFIITTTADLLTEGAETFLVQLRTDSNLGSLVANSAVITINDTSTTPTTYSITPDVTAVDEGNSVTMSVVTTDFGNGVLYWTVEGTGNAQATSADFVEDSGTVTITNNTGSFIITTTADLLTEGAETFRVQLRTDSIEGLVVANSAVITINDTSTTPPTYSITPDVTAVDEGNSVTMSVVTTDFGNGVLYWTVEGTGNAQATSADFVEDSGTVTITNNTGSFIITTTADLLTEGAETFRVQLRTDSIEGLVVANSAVITINDTSISPPPGPLANVVALHGFGPPGASTNVTINQIWRIDESGNNANIIATGTTGYRYYNSNDATFVSDGNIGTPAANILFGTGTFARLGSGGGSVANIAHSNNFIFSNAFTVECWATMPTNATSSTQGGLVSKWGYPVSGNATGNSWIMFMKTGNLVEARLSLDGSNTALTLTSNVTRTPRVWQHYVLERNDEDVVRLYLNGNIIAQGNLTGALYNNGPSPLIYGGGLTYLSSVLSGWAIDEVRITNGHAQYNGAFTPPTEPFPRANLTAIIPSRSNTFIKSEESNNRNVTTTTNTVTFSATGGDGTGSTYGYVFKHTLQLGATTGPILTLSNTFGKDITVSATGSPGDSAAGNVITQAIDPTGFTANITSPMLLTWDGVSVFLEANYLVSDLQISSQSVSEFRLTADGKIIQRTQGAGEEVVGDWVLPNSAASGNYSARATVDLQPTGSTQFSQGQFNIPLSLDQNRSWELTSAGPGFGEARFYLDILEGNTVLANTLVTLSVEDQQGG
jgi:predicted transcriptional regulator